MAPPRARRSRGRAAAFASIAALSLIAGCSSGSDSDRLETREPATPVTAPAASEQLPGDIFRFSNALGPILAEVGTGRVVALGASESSGTVLYSIDPATIGRTDPSGVPNIGMDTIALPAPGVDIAQGKPGEVLIAAMNRVIRVNVTTGTTTEVPVDGDVRSVQLRADDTLIAGTADGTVRTLTAGGTILDTISGLASADALAVTDKHVAVLDRRQTSVTELNLDKDRLGLSLRAGAGATNLITDPFGRIIVTDTAGGDLLVYTAGPLVLHQRFPVGSSPYALAYDQRSDTVWVTCTQSNEVVGFDLSTGIPEEVGRYATVRQPDSVTIDAGTGDLFVGSATGDGVQRIGADERKKGQR